MIVCYCLLLTHDASFGVLEELDDGLYLGAIGHLILDLVDDIEDACLSVEQQTVGVGNVLLHLLVDTGLAHHRVVGTSVFEGLTACDDKGRDVLREGGSGLYEGQTAHAGVGILDGGAGEDRTIVDLAVARNLHTITEYTVVAHDGIMADMRAFEQEVVVADLRHTVAVGSAVDDHILTDDIVVANLHIRFLATEVEVLWQGGDDGALVDLVVLANT